MEPSRSDSKSSSLRRQAMAAAIQTAADTMIAVTESFRQKYHELEGDAPQRPRPAYSHSRSSSGSSICSIRLLDDVAESGSDLEAGVPDVLVPGPRARRESQTRPQRSKDRVESARSQENYGITIRLSTPNLPERLNTPRTPVPKRYSAPAVRVFEDAQEPYSITMRPARHSYNVPTRHNSLLQASRQFRPRSHPYMALRPDCGNEKLPLGTVTHVRAGSDGDLLVSKEFRRKPLAPGARRITFNHSVTNELLFVAVICLSQVLMLAGFAQGLFPARVIAGTLGDTKVARQAWYTSAYMLTSGIFVFMGNRLGSIFGNKTIFVVGYLWLSLWSLMAGLSAYVDAGQVAYFCFCRAMQGIGPALLLPNGQAMLRKAYPPGSRKTLIMGLFDAAAPAGLVFGAVMASLFAEWTSFTSWPWAFYSLATVSVALAALSTIIIPGKDVVMHNLDGNMFVRLNGVGLFLSITGTLFFCVGWNQAPIVSFDSASFYVLIIIGALLVAGYVFIESVATHPLVPIQQMQVSAGVILGCNASLWAAFGIWIYYLVQFVETFRGWSALLLSAGFVPMLVTGLAACLLDASLLRGRFRPHLIMFIATLAVFVSSILMAMAPVQQTYWLNAFISIFIMPFGLVLANPASVALLNESVPEGHQGLALGLVGMVTSYAVSVGLGMAVAVEVYVRNDGGSVMTSYRAAQYFGLGLSGLSVLLALGFLLVSYVWR